MFMVRRTMIALEMAMAKHKAAAKGATDCHAALIRCGSSS
jgi:hypothetical protein